MPNAALVNFAAGETSPRSRGRADLAWFASSCRKLLNFIPEVSGPARYRSGFKYVRQTRAGAIARLVQFQVNDSRSYMLEFTNGKMRAYLNGDIITTSRTTITAATKANPCVITVASTTGLANGDEIIITGMLGMLELNGRQVKLANNVGSTYELVDPVTGININSTSYGTWTSGGTVLEVNEIDSPYLTADLDDLQWAQNNTEGYFVHPSYAPRKLTVSSTHAFTLATYSRTNDPFAVVSGNLTLTGVTLGTRTKITFTGTWDSTILYTVSGVVGTTQLNGNTYYVKYNSGGIGIPENPPQPYYYITDSSGNDIDSTLYGAWVSGGTFTPPTENPLSVTFYEGRLFFIGTNQRPNIIFGSMAPNPLTGATRYDTFTGGTAADNAVFFALAPTNGQVDYAAWARGTAKYLFVGTFGGPFRISGGGVDEPITPTSVNARQFDVFGCEAVMPAGGARLFYIQRGGRALRTPQSTAGGEVDELETYDMLLNAEHIAYSRMKRVVLQTGRPDVLWVVREDGILAGMTTQGAENIAGWHRHKTGGVDGKVLDAQPLPRTDKNDQLWIVAERVVAGVTRRTVEVLADDVDFPDLEDFFSGDDSLFLDAAEATPGLDPDATEKDDLAFFRHAVYRRQEEYVHLDSAGTYNGTDRGVAAAATLTPGALTGTGVTFTVSAAVFTAADVGNELWKKPDRDTGQGAGRAEITAFVSSTVVTCKILVGFDSLEAIAAGDWHIAAETIRNLWHLEGAQVAVVVDGAVYSNGRGNRDYPVVTVASGAITLPDPAGAVHIGLPYDGFLQTQKLRSMEQGVPANISELRVRFLNTLGVDYGTDLYQLEQVHHRLGTHVPDRPAPVFSGVKKLTYSDESDTLEGRSVIVAQRLPLPCVVQAVDIHFDREGD